MAIKMVYDPQHEQGEPDITRPAVICDYCGREINRAEDGIYLFDARLEHAAYWRSEPVELYTVHKENPRGCWTSFVESMEWDELMVAKGELSWLAVHLTEVLGVDNAAKNESLKESP